MIRLYKMSFSAMVKVFLAAMLFFVLIVQLLDVLANLWRYISNDVSFIDIGYISLLYFPKCISYALPVSLLFAIAYTLGTYYANNELISVFGAGVSLFRLTIPFLLFGLLLSFGNFFFEDQVVISTFKEKNEMRDRLLQPNKKQTLSQKNVAAISDRGKVIYKAELYDDARKSLRGVILVLRDEEARFEKKVMAEIGNWNKKKELWEFKKVKIYSWNDDETQIIEDVRKQYTSERFYEPPSTFQKNTRDIEEMLLLDAWRWIQTLQKAGLPFRKPLTDFHKRFAFSLTPLVVALISSAIGGRFKKNVLLMTLLTSLVIAVVYYVLNMVTVLMAKNGFLPPLVGAWASVVLFFITALGLFKIART